MSKYLLSCQCGKNVPVDIGQAGGRVVCACGKELEVPALRNLRHLPLDQSTVEKPRTAWNPRKGFIAAGAIIAALLVGGALWSRLTEPVVPKFDPAGHLSAVDTQLDKMTPMDSWMRWIAIYQPLANRGFGILEYPYTHIVEQQVAERRFLQKVLLIVAAIFAALALAATFWPSGKPVRR